MKEIKVGSDFSGVGAFDYAIKRIAEIKNLKINTIFACDWDKYVRQSYIANHGEPKYYPLNVYEREIPSESLDIYMTSPPCQSFSLAGKRLGKDDKRGVLFFNSHEFIQVNKPRFFIFENVKGLLSDDNGKTFSEWVAMLGGKSVNGNPVLFPYEDSVPYHLFWKVLNTKDFAIPQNRERVFLIGIRDDKDYNFRFPKEEHLTKKLKDVLEKNIHEKYFLTFSAINSIILNDKNLQKSKINPEISATIQSPGNACGVYKGMNAIKVTSGTSKGYENAIDGDSISLAHPGSQTRRGRVGHQVSQTIDCSPTQAIISYTRDKNGKVVKRNYKNTSNTIHTATGGGGNTDQFVIYNDKRLNETIAKNTLKEGEIKALDTYNKTIHDNFPTLKEPHHNDRRLWDGYKIRRLTPRECFRLQDFPDDFKFVVSDSQLYKQAGNSITIRVLELILNNLNL
jgi:DNA (cytosine-5)-methyltransferase 1